MKYLLNKYKSQYRNEEMHFEFQGSEINFEILKDFKTWKHTAFQDGEEEVVIFYKQD